MQSLLYVRSTTLALAMLMTSACGPKDDKNNGSGQAAPPLELSAFEQLTGEWVGIYRALEAGKPIGDASSASAALKDNGDFAISLDADATARVEGQWNEFQGKSLLLKVTGSSMPRISVSGKVVEPAYELLGSSLRITGEAFELKLSKKSAPTGPQGPGGAQSSFVGTWTCEGASQRKTSLVISGSDEFKLSSVRPNERIFIAQGKASASASGGLKLVPVSSSDPLPEGAFFEIRQSNASTEIFLHRDDTKQFRLGQCRK
jgi:hypothetical protein